MTISDDPVGSARWYCVHSKPRSEAVALQNLQRQGFECLLPRIAKANATVKPDHDLLLFMFGMSRGVGPQS